MLNPGTDVELSIEKPTAGGRMLARLDGQVVLVSDAIPGERVIARVERSARGVIWARAARILEPSPDRRVAAADPACGGNVLAHVEYTRQLAIKSDIVRDAFARLARLPIDGDIPVRASPERGYRLRARLHVHAGRAGFYREGTHQLCDVAQTGQLLPETLQILNRLNGGLEGIAGIELAENIAADQRALHFELEPGRRASRELATLAAWPGVTGVSSGIRGAAHGKVLGGSPEVSDPLVSLVPSAAGQASDARLVRHVRAFFQGNRFLLPELVQTVISQIDEGPAVDLYAGVGLFSVALAGSGRSGIVAVEGDRTNATDLRTNAAPFGDAIEVVHVSVEEYLVRSAPAVQQIILDPPRTGLSRDALAGLLARQPARIIYVSCDVATLARDVRALTDSGYHVRHVEAFDLFPNTAHVETLCVLGR